VSSSHGLLVCAPSCNGCRITNSAAKVSKSRHSTVLRKLIGDQNAMANGMMAIHGWKSKWPWVTVFEAIRCKASSIHPSLVDREVESMLVESALDTLLNGLDPPRLRPDRPTAREAVDGVTNKTYPFPSSSEVPRLLGRIGYFFGLRFKQRISTSLLYSDWTWNGPNTPQPNAPKDQRQPELFATALQATLCPFPAAPRS
jgi:hypothetical protein